MSEAFAAIERSREVFRNEWESAKSLHPKDSKNNRFDVEAYCAKYGIPIIETKTHGTSTLYILDHCVHDESHAGGEAAIGQTADGKLFSWCFHNSCKGKTWADARKIISGEDDLSEFCGCKEPVPDQKTASVIEIVDLEEIADAEYEENPVIEGLLDEQETLVVGAEGGTGKSLLLTFMALLGGNPSESGLFGMFRIPRPFTSVILQSENGLIATNRRIKGMIKGNPSLREGARHVFIPKSCRISGDLQAREFQDQIIEICEAVYADVLIIDPLISFHMAEENDNGAMRKTLDCLTAICDKLGMASIIAHHVGKNKNGLRGASAIRDWAANVLLLERLPDQKNIIMATHEKSRNSELLDPFYLELRSDLVLYRVEKPGRNFERAEKVVSCLRALGGRVEKKGVLESAVMTDLNRGRTTAQKSIMVALEADLIRIVPGKKGDGYELKS